MAALPEHTLSLLADRARLMGAVRQFFAENGFLEVDTPIAIQAPAPEANIEAIAAPEGWGDDQARFLRTSPELQMKRLVAAGAQQIFQIGSCFRANEVGRRHRPEFNMLEWYWAHADYRQLMQQAEMLVKHLAAAFHLPVVYQQVHLDWNSPFEILTVEDAFRKYAGVSTADALQADNFDLLLVEKVEPHLGIGRPTFLIDYPLELGALARQSASNPEVAERWELYIAGLELANAFGELTDAEEQHQRFLKEQQLRQQQGCTEYPLDADFLAELHRMPPTTSGCALGLDRLLMILTNASEINQVLLDF